jgi:pilus assembly protein Flp/PilA
MTIHSRFLKSRDGASAIEYALIAGGIAIAIVASVNGLGTVLGVKFASFATALN